LKAPDTTALKSSVQDRLPQQESAGNDLVAGLTFALVNIPQAMANALLAFVNPVSGLYTLMIGMPIAAIFTSTRLMNVSTNSALSVAAGRALVVIPSEFKYADTLLARTVAKYAPQASFLADWLEKNIPQGLTISAFPSEHQRRLRTTNSLERLNREIRCRSRVAM
jgi:MFS superfamily sulfate permease-like transporter